jgi:hypothetical protein
LTATAGKRTISRQVTACLHSTLLAFPFLDGSITTALRWMGRLSIRWLMVVGVFVGLTAVGAWAYRAWQHVPEFYTAAIHSRNDTTSTPLPETQRPAVVVSADSGEAKSWKGTFSDEQINKFLAVELPQKHPDILPPGIYDPRVAIRRGQASIGWRAEGKWSAIYSLVIEPYVPRPNVLAIRIKRIRAGALPMPLGEVVEGVSQAAQQANLRLQWQQIDGDPVAIVELPVHNDSGRTMVLDSVALRAGEIIVSGHIEDAAEEVKQASTLKADTQRAATHAGVNESRQR